MLRTNVLKPHICDTSAITRQIIEFIQTVKVVDGQVKNSLGLGEPDIDSNAPSTVWLEMQATPTHYTSAGIAEVNLECRPFCIYPCICGTRS
jgi:hypothetical protein